MKLVNENSRVCKDAYLENIVQYFNPNSSLFPEITKYMKRLEKVEIAFHNWFHYLCFFSSVLIIVEPNMMMLQKPTLGR